MVDMGDATYGCVQRVRHEFGLTSPTNSVEVEKAFRWAMLEFPKYHGREASYDSDIWVAGDGEHIVVYFDEPEKKVSPSSREEQVLRP